MRGFHGMNQSLKLFLLYRLKGVIKIQISLKLAWRLTINKSQGLMLEKTNINIGKQERKGMTFTQVKALNGLQFQYPFSYDQYEKMTKVACVAI